MADVYSAPGAPLTSDASTGSDSIYGGIGRMKFFLYSVAVQMISMFVIVSGALLTESMIAMVASYVLYLAGLGYLAVLRFRNQGSSAWWAVGMFVPLLNIYVTLRALAYPEGYQENRQLDLTGKVIVGVFVGSVLVMLVGGVFLPLFAAATGG